MNLEHHLILQTTVIAPSGEWTPPAQGWVVVRVDEGAGYWMHRGAARELQVGDGFVVSGYRGMVVRASQLGALKLDWYLVQPPLLNGMLTVTEGNRLDQVAHSQHGQIIFFTATEAAGLKLARLVHQVRPESLPSRAGLFQFWSQAVSGLLTQPIPDESGHKLRQRFRHLVAQMPDTELARQSLSRLAGLLDCSERHFSRLFRQEFGLSLRARQAELRLQRARQLLADPHDKISQIAFESGYRHLGLFNSMFKKRFGVTPGEWRRNQLAMPVNGGSPEVNPAATIKPAESDRPRT